MAQFDVHRFTDGTLVVDVQADVVGIEVTRAVVPLLTPDDDLFANPRIAPALTVGGEARLFATPLISVARHRDLSRPIGSLKPDRLIMQKALDLLLNGSP